MNSTRRLNRNSTDWLLNSQLAPYVVEDNGSGNPSLAAAHPDTERGCSLAAQPRWPFDDT
jgi:hypothetical protein